MRIRNAAIAGATALAVAFAGTTVASAQTDAPAAEDSSSYDGIFGSSQQANSEGETENKGSLSSRIGDNLNADKEADGRALFGSSKENEERGATWEGQPAWAKALYIATVVAGVASALGVIVGPLHNFLVHGPNNF